MSLSASVDPRLARRLVLDELFDLSLYRAVYPAATPDLRQILDQLIPIESRHFEFWQEFFGLRVTGLDFGRRLKLALIVALCRVFGASAIHLVLEAIEVHGVRKYLRVWRAYRDGPLGAAVRNVLEDEFRHEDTVVTGDAGRRINPERVRDIFLGLNDGLIEIVGAVSGFFAAFGQPLAVLVAGSTVAVAGAMSMAAGAYIATGSGAEVRRMEIERRRFLGEAETGTEDRESALASALLVGGSYLAGALVPVLPVVFGARTALPSIAMAGSLVIIVSVLLAFLSGMDIRRRVLTNAVLVAAAVAVTYGIGLLTRRLWGIAV